MRPTLAIVRAAIPGRAGLLAAVLAASLLARVTVLDAWEGSDAQSMAALLLQLVLLPIFSAMLGGALVQGEHARWSWGLARPMRRRQWVAISITLDVLTLALAGTIIRMVVGECPVTVQRDVFATILPDASYGLASGAQRILLIACYLGAAVGAARGRPAVRAIPLAALYALGSIGLTAGLMWSDDLLARCFVVDAWRELGRRYDDWRLLALALFGGMGHVVAGAVTRLPSTISRGYVLRRFALWSFAAAILSLCNGTRLQEVPDAPLMARRGDATIEIAVPANARRVILTQSDCDSCTSREYWVAPNDRRVARFEDVVAGHHRVCLPFEITVEPERYPRFELETCLEVDLASGEQREQWRMEDAFVRVLPPGRSTFRDYRRPFAGLPILRSTTKDIERLMNDPERFGQPIFRPWS